MDQHTKDFFEGKFGEIIHRLTAIETSVKDHDNETKGIATKVDTIKGMLFVGIPVIGFIAYKVFI